MANCALKIESHPLRPCLVNGRRALFHCWSIMARAVPPKGMSESETDERFQYASTRGLVEFEDGTMGRPWPSEIRFIDGGNFDAWDWEQMEQAAAQENEEETPWTMSE